VLVFVNNTWYDPQTILTQSGDLNLPGNATINGSLVVGGVDILAEVEDMDSLITTLASQVTAHTTNLQSLTSQYAGLATNVSSLELVVSSQQDQIDALNSTLATNSELLTTNSLGIGVPAPATDSGKLVDTLSGAYLSASGVWTNVSDENKKTNFTEVDKDQILVGILELGITRWNYKSDSDHITHIGPTAQQFYSVFGVGDNDKTISTLDPASIALVGVQALSEQITRNKQQVANLENKVDDQQDQISTLFALNTDGEINMKKLAEEMEEIRLTQVHSNKTQDTSDKQETNTNNQEANVETIQYTESSIQEDTEAGDLLATLIQRLDELEGLVLGTTDTLPEPFVATVSGEIESIEYSAEGIQEEEVEATVSAELDTEIEFEEADISAIRSDIELLTQTISLATESAVLSQQTLELTGENNQATLENLTVAGKAQVYDLNIAGKLTTGFIEIDGIAGSITTVMQPLQLQTNPLAGNIEAFDRKIVMTSNGDIEIQGTLRAEKVETKEIVAQSAVLGKVEIATESSKLQISSDKQNSITNDQTDITSTISQASLGKAVLKEGRRRVLVRTSALTENSSVFVTATSSTGGQSMYVEDIIPGRGFYAEVDEVVSEDLGFNWWVVN
jgi:hypothetical protein